MNRLERARAASLARRQAQTANARPGVLAPSIVAPSGAGIRKGKRPGRDKGQGEWRTTSAYDKSGRNPQWDRTVSSV